MAERDALIQSNSNSNNSNETARSGYGAISTTNEVDEVAKSEESNTTSNILDDMKSSFNILERIGYGLGHVYNDLSAGVWFSYTLLFLQGSLQMPSKIAGALVMLGQVGDAIATPIAGYMADRYGTKRKWHAFGTILVFLAFPAIFSICPFCDIISWWEPVYFTIVILFFQLGWAIVQITHLAMIPELSRTQRDRSDLTAIRYTGSVCSNVIVFIVTWAVLHARNKNDTKIGPQDAYRFRDISLILTLIGISMAVLFQFSLSIISYESRRYQSLNQHTQSTHSSSSGAVKTSDGEADVISIPSAMAGNHQTRRLNFFRLPLLYQNAFLYVFSRLFMTTSLVYMPLWLNERIPDPTDNTIIDTDLPNKSIEHIATIPLVSFLSSFVSSVILKYSHRVIGQQIHYFFGSLISLAACTWVGLANVATLTTLELYGIAILFGAGSSITMISSLCITADMIGPHSNQGGFIYSIVTFADKLITGIVIMTIESIKCESKSECPEYYRDVLAFGCGVASILGLFILLTLRCNRNSRIIHAEH